MSQNTPFVERRKHDRFQVTTAAAFAVLTKRSGLITEISLDGMTLHYIDRKSTPEENRHLDIVVDAPFCSETSFCLKGLPFRAVSDSSFPKNLPDSSPSVKRLGIQFAPLTPAQQTALQCFIDHLGEERQPVAAMAAG